MNKTNLSISLSALCAVLLVALLVRQSNQMTQLDVLRQQYETSASANTQQQQEVRDGVAKLADQLKNVGTNLESRLAQSEQQQKEQRAERETNFRDMRQQLDDIVSSGALFPNKSKPASEAVALAKAAERTGNTALAKIYYLSAINHAPSEISILHNYAELVFRDSSATAEDFAQLKSVLQISLYQIPPASVTNALGVLSKAMRREEQLLAAQTPKPVPVNWQQRFEQLTKSNTLDDSWPDLKKISRRWDGLNEIAESLREEQPDTDLTKQVERELELTQRVLAAARLSNALDTMMAALNSSSEQPEKAVSLLQMAEATLGQMWGIDSAGCPAALRSKIDQYPKEIQSRVEVLAEVKSRPFLAKVEAERASVSSYVAPDNLKSLNASGQRWQKIITEFNGCFERAAAAAQNISSAEGRKKAEAIIKEINELALDAKRQQFDDYQKWVLGRCQIAFDSYNNTKIVTQNDALTFFKNANLAAVDQGVLAVAVSRAFNDVLAKLTAEMDGKAVFSVQKDCAEQPKKRLEEF